MAVQQLQQQQSKTTIYVKDSENEGKLVLSFPYNITVINAVKSNLFYRRYDPKTRTWEIHSKELHILINNLRNDDSINIDNLLNQYEVVKANQLISELNPTQLKPVVTLFDYSNLSIQPMQHQVDGARYLIEEKTALLADEMGVGKTKTSILALASITGNKLIICPATIKLNWEKEIKQVDTTAIITIISGSKWTFDSNKTNTTTATTTTTKAKANQYVIINYDILNNHVEDILKSKFKAVVFDEAHYMKAINNSGKPSSNRAKHCLAIADKIEYVFTLTGTPTTGKARDLRNILTAIKHPLGLCKFFTYAQKYCDAKHNGWGWEFNGFSNQPELYKHLQQKMLRRKKEEVLTLPEKVRTFIPVSINLKAYNIQLQDYMLERDHIEQGKHLVKLNAMRHILAKDKAPQTIKFVSDLLEQDKKVVVFTNYTNVVEQLKEAFPDNSRTLTGETTADVRQANIEAFQNDSEVKVFICNIIAGGVGVTLTASSNVVFNDYDWLPTNHIQAEDRTHRFGQRSDVNIYYLYAHNAHSDEMMTRLIERKLNDISNVIDNKTDTFVNDKSIYQEMVESFDRLR